MQEETIDVAQSAPHGAHCQAYISPNKSEPDPTAPIPYVVPVCNQFAMTNLLAVTWIGLMAIGNPQRLFLFCCQPESVALKYG